MDLSGLRQAVRGGRIEWRKHALVRMGERNISQSDILEAIAGGEPIEEYEEDRPFPSVLLFAEVDGRPLHVVAAYYSEQACAFVITVYEPSLEEFEPDFRTRRRSP